MGELPKLDASLTTRRATRSGTRFSWILPAASWAVFIVSFPFYVQDSGLPQPSHIVVAVCVAAILAFNRSFVVSNTDVPVVAVLTQFLIYTVVVSLVWALILSSTDVLWAPAFYTFNFMLLLAGIHLRTQNPTGFIRLTYVALLCALIWQLALGGADLGAMAGRESLYFNNANQLGYFGIIGATLFSLPHARSIPMPMRAAGFMLSVALALLSASQATVVALGSLFVVTAILRPKSSGLLLVGGGLVIASVWPLTGPVISERMDIQSPGLTEAGLAELVEDRGYDRIWRHPEYLLFGAAEGAFERFDSAFYELHSTPGTVLFSYGLIGAGLVARGLWLAFRYGVGSQIFYLIPAAVYSLTHQGLRFSMLWVLVVVVLTNPSSPASAVTQVTSRTLAFGARTHTRQRAGGYKVH